jgi:hypothetical protein
MEFSAILSILQGWLFLLILFGISLVYVLARGRQHLINLMVGLYLGLLFLQLFPYKEVFTKGFQGDDGEAIVTLGIFAIFTIFSTLFFSKLMPREYLEGTFESFGKKLFLALSSTLLLMTLSTHFLPVGELVDIGTPLPPIVLSSELGFFSLILTLILLFLLA